MITLRRPSLRLVPGAAPRPAEAEERVPPSKAPDLGTAGRRPRAPRLTPAEREAAESARLTAVRSAERDLGLLMATTGLLCLIGLVMVLSASTVPSLDQFGSEWSIFMHQLEYVGLGIGALTLACRLSPGFLRRAARPLLIVCLGLLVAVNVPGVGQVAGGSSRWLGTGLIRFQPSELMKLALVVFAADLVARRERLVTGSSERTRLLVIPIVLVYMVAAPFVFFQPDLGTTIVLFCIVLGVLYAVGTRLRLLFAASAGAFLVTTIYALNTSYQRQRLSSFLDPLRYARGAGYQVVQSFVALQQGGAVGSGLGRSTAAIDWLPNAHTDFIFAVVGGELGLAGAVAVLALIGIFTYSGLRVAARTTDRFSSVLATGVTCWVFFESVLNVGGVIGVVPVTGIPLPFVSYGGTSIVVVMFGAGLLMGVARRNARAAAVMSPARAASRAAALSTAHEGAAAASSRRGAGAASSRRGAAGSSRRGAAGSSRRGAAASSSRGAAASSRRGAAAGRSTRTR